MIHGPFVLLLFFIPRHYYPLDSVSSPKWSIRLSPLSLFFDSDFDSKDSVLVSLVVLNHLVYSIVASTNKEF